MRGLNTEGGRSNTRPYFPELDGVRAVAALLVMVFHFSQYWHGIPFLILGQTGVDLFFVLSGFLITTILLQAQHGDWREVRSFYIRRTLRIFPLYYGFLCLMLAVGAAVSPWFWVYLQNWPMALHMPVAGPGHFWSLAVEEQFYLVWPFLVLFWPRRWLAGAMWGVFGFAVLLRGVLVFTLVDTFPLTLTRLDSLAAGGLLALGYRRGVLERLRPLLMSMAVVSATVMGIQWWISRGHGVPWVTATKFVSSEGLYVSVIGLLITSAATPVHSFLRSRAMRGIGRVSYGLYVYHPAVFIWLPWRLGHLPLMLKAVICFAAVYGVALVSFYGFEKRFTDLKKKLAPEKRFREAMVSAS